MAVVAPSTTGDTYTGVLLGIPVRTVPGNNDRWLFSVTRQSNLCNKSAVTTSTLNGLLWGFDFLHTILHTTNYDFWCA